MRFSLGLCLLLALSWTAQGLGHKNDDYHMKERQKRAGIYTLYTIGRGVLSAIKATREVLKDARTVLDDKVSTLYMKQGDLNQAMYDFALFKPTQTFDYASKIGTSGKWAEVGDRTIILESSVSTRPTLQIIRGLGTSNEHIDKIKYMDY